MPFPLQPADHARAQAVLAAVLANLDDAQLAASTPCTGWTVTDVLVHLISGARRVGEVEPLAGPPKTTAEAREQAAEAGSAAQAVFDTPGTLERIYTLPGGNEAPGIVVLQLRTTDTLVHAWDIAVATGQGTDLDPSLAETALTASHQLIRPELRGEGRPFGSEQQPPAAATTADRLAAFLGRTRG